MKKITLSLDVIAAIIAVTILQACANTAGTQCVCEKPTLTPASGPAAIVIIKTATMGASLRYTLNGSTPTGGTSGHGTPIASDSGDVPVPFVFGRTMRLQAIAWETGLADSAIATGYYSSPCGRH